MKNKRILSDFFVIMGFMRSRMALYLFGLIGVVIVDASFTLIVPFIMKDMFDAAVIQDMQKLKQGVLIASVEVVTACILFGLTTMSMRISVNRTLTDIRKAVFRQVQALPVSHFEKKHTGDIISRVSNDMKGVEVVISGPLRFFLLALVTGVGSAAAMFLLDWKIGSILIVFAFFSALISSRYSMRIRTVSQNVQKALAALTERVSDIFGGISVVKIFPVKEDFVQKFQNENELVSRLIIERTKKEAFLSSLNFFISWINFGGIVAVGSLMIMKGSSELGKIIAIINLLGGVNFMIKRLGDTMAQLVSNFTQVERVVDLLNFEIEPERYPGEMLTVSDAMISFRNVGFAYDEDKAVLSGIDFSVSSGQVAALAGPSGGGKSTVMKLLLGFYPPSAGNIFINGKSLGAYSLKELRSLMAYVPQDSYLFDGTIYDNIMYGNPDADEDDIYRAAAAAHADSFIKDFSDGYSTEVGERGIKLSGGQKQRIAIARALLKDAPILLLDEATSSLDSISEQLVQDALSVLMENRTVLVIAHRLSTIQNADKIFVVENGRVVEQGKHHELIAEDGVYARLCALQFSSKSG